MLWQLHHQFKNGHTDFMTQLDGSNLDNNEKIRAWVEETNNRHPVPEDATWLMCNEESEHFVWKQGYSPSNKKENKKNKKEV